MPADHPQFLQPRAACRRSGEGRSRPAAAPAAPAAPGASNVEGAVRGSLVLDAKLKDKAKPGAVIFLSARGAQGGAPAGPPLAVKRLTVGAWPQPFELSAADAMMPGLTLRGQVVLSARIDQDEDAMTKQPATSKAAWWSQYPPTPSSCAWTRCVPKPLEAPPRQVSAPAWAAARATTPRRHGHKPHAGMGANPTAACPTSTPRPTSLPPQPAVYIFPPRRKPTQPGHTRPFFSIPRQNQTARRAAAADLIFSTPRRKSRPQERGPKLPLGGPQPYSKPAPSSSAD